MSSKITTKQEVAKSILKEQNRIHQKNPKNKSKRCSKLAELNKLLRETVEVKPAEHQHSNDCNHAKKEEVLLTRKNGEKETQKQKDARQARNKIKERNQKAVVITSIPKPSRKENRTLESTMKRSSVLNKKQVEGKVKLNKAKADKEELLIKKIEKQLKIGRSRLGKIDALRLKLLAAQEKYTNMLRAKHEARQK